MISRPNAIISWHKLEIELQLQSRKLQHEFPKASRVKYELRKKGNSHGSAFNSRILRHGQFTIFEWKWKSLNSMTAAFEICSIDEGSICGTFKVESVEEKFFGIIFSRRWVRHGARTEAIKRPEFRGNRTARVHGHQNAMSSRDRNARWFLHGGKWEVHRGGCKEPVRKGVASRHF